MMRPSKFVPMTRAIIFCIWAAGIGPAVLSCKSACLLFHKDSKPDWTKISLDGMEYKVTESSLSPKGSFLIEHREYPGTGEKMGWYFDASEIWFIDKKGAAPPRKLLR